MKPIDFLTRALIAAKEANHIWPEYAAAEAALESGWGESRLAKEANNLFGQKAGFTTKGCTTINIPTREVLSASQVARTDVGKFLKPPVLRPDGKYDCWVNAVWPKFEAWADSFRARMALLAALPCYASALKAETGEKFVIEVSKHWATDPNRGNACLATYRAHFKDGEIV